MDRTPPEATAPILGSLGPKIMPRHLVGLMRGRLLLPAEGFGIGPGKADICPTDKLNRASEVIFGFAGGNALLLSSNVDAANVKRASPNAAKQRRLRAEISAPVRSQLGRSTMF
jgi:hypothetical protein